MAFDSAGNLYVVNSGDNTIRKISPHIFGTSSGSIFASGLGSPRFVAIGPDVVPEPSEWALVILGLGALFGAARRRVKVTAVPSESALPCVTGMSGARDARAKKGQEQRGCWLVARVVEAGRGNDEQMARTNRRSA